MASLSREAQQGSERVQDGRTKHLQKRSDALSSDRSCEDQSYQEGRTYQQKGRIQMNTIKMTSDVKGKTSDIQGVM